MALQGAFKVEFGEVFPHGAFVVGDVEPVRDFEASKSKGSPVQQRDKATGDPLWVVEVLDADPEAREKTVKVKIASPVQPVPPEAAPGMPFRPVEFDGLTVTPYVKDAERGRPRVGLSLRARGMRAPGKAGKASSSSAQAA